MFYQMILYNYIILLHLLLVIDENLNAKIISLNFLSDFSFLLSHLLSFIFMYIFVDILSMHHLLLYLYYLYTRVSYAILLDENTYYPFYYLFNFIHLVQL